MDPYVPSGPSDSARVRSFAEAKLKSLGESEVGADKHRFWEWMTALNNELLGITSVNGPKERLPKKGVTVLGGDEVVLGGHGAATSVGSALPITSEMRNPSLSGLTQLKELRSKIAAAGGSSNVAFAPAQAGSSSSSSSSSSSGGAASSSVHSVALDAGMPTASTRKVSFETGAVVGPGADLPAPARRRPSGGFLGVADGGSQTTTGMMHGVAVQGAGDDEESPAPATTTVTAAVDGEASLADEDHGVTEVATAMETAGLTPKYSAEPTASATSTVPMSRFRGASNVEPSPPGSYAYELDFSGNWAQQAEQQQQSKQSGSGSGSGSGATVEGSPAKQDTARSSVDLSGLTMEGARRLMSSTR